MEAGRQPAMRQPRAPLPSAAARSAPLPQPAPGRCGAGSVRTRACLSTAPGCSAWDALLPVQRVPLACPSQWDVLVFCCWLTGKQMVFCWTGGRLWSSEQDDGVGPFLTEVPALCSGPAGTDGAPQGEGAMGGSRALSPILPAPDVCPCAWPS